MSDINFARDLRIFAPRMGDNLADVVSQVAIVDQLPSMFVAPGLGEAKAHLLEVATHLNGEDSYVGGALELHTISLCGRAMRLANAFATEDIHAERKGAYQILNGNEWRTIHQAIINGCAGSYPVLRRNGTLRPPKWAVDLLQLTSRLAEIGQSHEEVRLKARALSEPSADERKLAEQLGQMMIRRKNDHIRDNPEAVVEAESWIRINSQNITPRLRPEGGLDIDGMVWVRMSAPYRSPMASEAYKGEVRKREIDESKRTTLVVGAHADKPFRADRECVGILRDNARVAQAYVRSSRRSA